MMLDIVIEADAEWDSSSDWEALVRRAAEAAIALLKFFALLGGIFLIMRTGVVTGLSLAVGYGAMPMGITVGGLFGPKPPES